MVESFNRIIQTVRVRALYIFNPNKSYTNRTIQIVPSKTALMFSD